MRSIENLTYEELMWVKQILETKDIKRKIEEEIELRNNLLVSDDYSSARMPSDYLEYEENCHRLLSKLTYNDVPFFNYSFRNPGNNNYSYIGNSYRRVYCEASGNLSKFNSFFQNPKMVYGYEGIYNTFNYIKMGIVNHLRTNPNLKKSDLLKDLEAKNILIKIHLKEIVENLMRLRSQIPNSRLSIENQTLRYLITKKNNDFTPLQQQFIDALAFANTLENLENKKFEYTSRLLFVPAKNRKKLLKEEANNDKL